MTTPAGHFVWHDLQTRDCAKALSFYRELVGWETKETARGGGALYALCTIGGRDIAGITTSKAPAHVPAYWLPYVWVDDVDAKVKEAEYLGALQRHRRSNRCGRLPVSPVSSPRRRAGAQVTDATPGVPRWPF